MRYLILVILFPLAAFAQGPVQITKDQTWQTNKRFGDDVVIMPRVTLTIGPRTVISFSEKTRIIVKPGAHLILDGGTLTNACNGMWKGIEDQGTATASQNPTDQGWVQVINGGTIENAEIGIQTIKMSDIPPPAEATPNYSYTGGMVLCDGAIFKNNRTAVKFWPYDHAASNSLFRYCQFISDDDMLDGTDPGYFIKMTGISGITIGLCNFTDYRAVTDPIDLTSGIEAHDAYFKVFATSVFENLNDGIRAYAINPAKTVSIKNSQFIKNLRSVYLSAVMEATLTFNEFKPWTGDVPAGEKSYCVYLDHCTDYTVEENTFGEAPAPPPWGTNPLGIGLIINNSGPDNNMVYNNFFGSLAYATLAQNENRGEYYDDGLVIKCNDYENNDYDISVTANEEAEYPGIARNQGAPGGTDMQAGNLFSLNEANGIDESDYSTFKQGPITYFHHNPVLSNEPRVEPIFISKYVTPLKQDNAFSKENSCPSHLSGGGSGGGSDRDGLLSKMENNELKADSTQALLTTLVDGGNTDVLQQEVLQTMPPEAYDLYMSLMGKSPYLSDSVLIAIIEKEDILPNVIIKDILAANPQAAKSPEIMDKVEEKTIPMTDEMIAEILLGKYVVAAKEKLESQFAHYKNERATALKFLKQSYLNDTIDPFAQDSLIALLENETALQEKYQLVFAYLNKDNFVSAENLLNSIPSLISLSNFEQGNNNDFIQMFNVISAIQATGISVDSISTEMKQTLLQLADNSVNVSGAIARNILIKADGYEYSEPIILPEASMKSSIIIDLRESKNFKPEYIKLYPNPAMNYIIIELNKTNLSGVNIAVYDNKGIVVKTVTIPGHNQDYVLGLKDVKPGIYIIKAKMDGKNIGSKKFSLIK